MISYDFREMGQSTTVFFDKGSNVSLITKKLANELFLEGRSKLTSIMKACDQVAQAIPWIHNDILLQDWRGILHKLRCIEVLHITKQQHQPNYKDYDYNHLVAV